MLDIRKENTETNTVNAIETQIGSTHYIVRREFSASAKEDAYHVMKRLVQQAARHETEEK